MMRHLYALCVLGVALLCAVAFAKKSRISREGHDVINEECGKRPALERPQPRVFNGRDAVPGAWPWVGRVVPRPEALECHVTLIDDQWAVTTPYCAALAKDRKVIFGDSEIDELSPDHQELGVRRFIVHPEFILLKQYAVALIQLDNPVEITDYVRPVCLNSLQNEWEAYDSCWIAGWGEINANYDYPKVLQEAQVEFLEGGQYCRNHSSRIYAKTGVNGQPQGCSDDYGSPAVCYGEDDRWHLVATMDAYSGWCGNTTTIYNRISPEIEFITDHIDRIKACSSPDILCSDGVTCVLEDEICDGQHHCPDGDDETTCPGPICSAVICQNRGTCNEDIIGSFKCECPVGWNGKYCEKGDCGQSSFQLAPGQYQNLTSPLYPKEYPSDLSCEYTINAPQGHKVMVKFTDFDVEAGFDKFYIGDSLITGTDRLRTYQSDGNTLTIRFESDEVYGMKGFDLQLSAIDVADVNECDENPCQFNGTCIDEEDGYSCFCVDKRLGKDCITADDYCGPGEISLENADSAVYLSSFFYGIGNLFGVQYSCRYMVKAPQGHRVRIVFNGVNILKDYDTLILNNKVWNNFDEFESEDNHLEIVYRAYGLPEYDGFDLSLFSFQDQDGDECASQPCQHGGQCYDKENDFRCKCRRGFTGKTCQQRTGASPCDRNAVLCNNGRCVKASDICNGVNNCGDGSDELNCDCEFHCYNGRCLPQRLVCDKNDNCGDWSDELRPHC